MSTVPKRTFSKSDLAAAEWNRQAELKRRMEPVRLSGSLYSGTFTSAYNKLISVSQDRRSTIGAARTASA